MKSPFIEVVSFELLSTTFISLFYLQKNPELRIFSTLKHNEKKLTNKPISLFRECEVVRCLGDVIGHFQSIIHSQTITGLHHCHI